MRYDASRASLYEPGLATNFFEPRASEFLRNEAALCAEMARLAYTELNPTYPPMPCVADFLPRVGFATLGTYDVRGTQAFLACSEDGETAVLAFRGTENDDFSDIVTDANFLTATWQDRGGETLGRVHRGFAAALLLVLEEIERDLQSAQLSRAKRLLITGHSLGAALAVLMAARRPEELIAAATPAEARLYTFGCPRVGDEKFAEAMAGVHHERYMDCCDIVCRIPPELIGYRHSGELKYIDCNGRILNNPDQETIDADRRGGAMCYVLRYSFLFRTVAVRDLADHAPINYLSAVLGARDPEDDCP